MLRIELLTCDPASISSEYLPIIVVKRCKLYYAVESSDLLFIEKFPTLWPTSSRTRSNSKLESSIPIELQTPNSCKLENFIENISTKINFLKMASTTAISSTCSLVSSLTSVSTHVTFWELLKIECALCSPSNCEVHTSENWAFRKTFSTQTFSPERSTKLRGWIFSLNIYSAIYGFDFSF